MFYTFTEFKYVSSKIIDNEPCDDLTCANSFLISLYTNIAKTHVNPFYIGKFLIW